MGRRSKTVLNPQDEMCPAMDPVARLQQLKALAVDQAEKQLREGTASSQVVTYFLKATPEEDALRLRNLELQNELLEEKKKQIQSEQTMQELAINAINAFRDYSGATDE